MPPPSDRHPRGDLTSHEVTGLSGGMKYIWKVGYIDSGSGITSWSGEYHFKIGVNVSDALPEVIAGTDEYQLMVEHFADAVLGNGDLDFPPEESVNNMRVLDALAQAARERRPVFGGQTLTID